MRARWFAFALFLAPALGTAPARAQGTRTQRFFFRGALGAGYGLSTARFENSMPQLGLDFSGGGALGAFSIGVNVLESLAVHVDVCALALVRPLVEVTELTTRQVIVPPSTTDSTSSASLLGLGVTWRHRSNFWFSVGGGATQLSLEVPFSTAAGHGLTSYGGGAQLLLGFDWSLGQRWYAGGALMGIVSIIPDSVVDLSPPTTFYTVGGGLVVTFTNR